MTSLYPSMRSSNCIFINCILINLKQRPVKITGKNIKSYATAQVHFPQEREGSLMAKSPNLSFKNMIRLNRTYYLLLKFSQAKLLKIWSFGQNSNKLSKIHSIRLYTPRIVQNSHPLLTYLYYVSGTCPGREPCRIPANYANSTQFAHTVRKLREIPTFC